MHLHYRNINDGFRGLVAGLLDGTVPADTDDSRNGPVLRCAEPTTLSFSNPTERVLFNAVRDVNPFSVLYEAMWALAGRNDVGPISYYTRRMADYSDDGKTWHGAYGHRWRSAAGDDQLRRAAELLRGSAGTRRVVLTMWDAGKDLLNQRADGRDYPCNTHVYLTVRGGRLNATVCNRSNDACWGLFGTNYVLFTFLQEYLAAAVGVSVGTYHHVSNDLHVYTDRSDWRPAELLADQTPGWYDAYLQDTRTVPLVRDPTAFERELPLFVERHACLRQWVGGGLQHYTEPFLTDVAEPLLAAFHYHKDGRHDLAADSARAVKADDWCIVAEAWLRRRAAKRKEKA